MSDDELYEKVWNVVASYVGDGIEADSLTDQIWDIICDDAETTFHSRSRNITMGFMMGSMYPFK